MIFNIANIMSCENFADKGVFGGCSMAWLTLVLIAFVAAVLRRQTDDGALQGTGFHFIGAMIAGLGGGLLLITLTGDFRFGLVAGLAGVGAGGFLLGRFLDGGQ